MDNSVNAEEVVNLFRSRYPMQFELIMAEILISKQQAEIEQLREQLAVATSPVEHSHD